MVKLMYAMKCNPEPVLLDVLASLGTGFDCASQSEIDMILDLGLASDRIIFAHPCKMPTHILHARRVGIRRTTFDSFNELAKIRELFPEMELILRIAASDPTAQVPLSNKFGADPSLSKDLLQEARRLGLNVVGICFHVGCGCNDSSAYSRGISDARLLFNFGKEIGFQMRILDIGGGYPGEDLDHFRKIARVIRSSLREEFNGMEVEIFGEPGRFMSATPFSLVLNIIGVKELTKSKIDYLPINESSRKDVLFV